MEIKNYLKLSKRVSVVLYSFVKKRGPNKNQLKIQFKGLQNEHE